MHIICEMQNSTKKHQSQFLENRGLGLPDGGMVWTTKLTPPNTTQLIPPSFPLNLTFSWRCLRSLLRPTVSNNQNGQERTLACPSWLQWLSNRKEYCSFSKCLPRAFCDGDTLGLSTIVWGRSEDFQEQWCISQDSMAWAWRMHFQDSWLRLEMLETTLPQDFSPLHLEA